MPHVGTHSASLAAAETASIRTLAIDAMEIAISDGVEPSNALGVIIGAELAVGDGSCHNHES